MATAKATVLCVDDDVRGLTIRAMVLEKLGYEVLTATDGEQALKLFHHRKVDAVLIDYYMPMLDGGYVAHAMRQLNPGIPIVMISGNTALPQGALVDSDAFLVKGSGPVEMTETIEKVLRNAA